MLISLRQAVEILHAGDIVAVPTEAVYGLSCDPRNEQAVAALLRLKARDVAKGFIVVASAIAQLADWVDWSQVTPAAYQQAQSVWPGPVTLVVPAQPSVSPLIRGEFTTLAVRVTAHPVLQALCAACGHPLLSTSANISGQSPARTPAEIEQQWGPSMPIVEGALGGLEKPTMIIDMLTGQRLR